MEVYTAVSAKGQHDLRADCPNALGDDTGQRVEILLRQLSVGIMQDLMPSNAEHRARRGQLCTTHLAKLGIVSGLAAMVRRLAIRQAQQVGLDAVPVSHQQGPAEGSALVVRMCSYAEQAEGQIGSSEGRGLSQGSVVCATGLKLLRCSGHGPCLSSAARCCGVL